MKSELWPKIENNVRKDIETLHRAEGNGGREFILYLFFSMNASSCFVTSFDPLLT